MEKPLNAFIPNFLLTCAGEMELLKLKLVSRNPKKSQEKTLRHILTYAKDTVYGKEQHFDEILQAKTADELFEKYKKYVPANDYEDLRPYVERHKHGEKDILFPGKPFMYATTSGTTDLPKWVPITYEYFNDVYGKMTRLWMYSFIMNRPKVFTGVCVSIVGKTIEGYAPDGTIFGSVSGVTQKNVPNFLKHLYASPYAIYGIKDYNARYYALMRMGIERNVTLIITANASTIVELENNANLYYDEYVKDIENGTLSDKFNIEPEIRVEIEKCLKPNPERAAELRALKEKYGTVLPKHYWPNLQVLNTWKCGNTKVYVDKLEGSFPEQMMHKEFGYFASECRFGLTLDGSNNTVLFPHYHYYEFVAEEELGTDNPHFLRLDQLQEGKRYCSFVTTLAGLYRYNMNDLIEVGPFFKNTPTVHMIQKVNGIVTITGEKLHERQFIEAIHKAEATLKMPLRFFVGFADVEDSRYHFYYEFADLNTTQEQAEKFTEEVDKELRLINIEYEQKRVSLRLKDARTYRLQRDAFEKFKQQCIEEGFRDGQFKINLLMQDEKRHAKFKKLVIE